MAKVSWSSVMMMPLRLQQTTDGEYIVTGASASNDDEVSGNHGGYDYWAVKLTDTGAIQWQKSLGGTVMIMGMQFNNYGWRIYYCWL